MGAQALGQPVGQVDGLGLLGSLAFNIVLGFAFRVAKTLAQLVLTLESREPFPLDRLYELDMDQFDLALDILKEWRLDRYYAGKSKLYDLSLQTQALGASTPSVATVAPAASKAE